MQTWLSARPCIALSTVLPFTQYCPINSVTYNTVLHSTVFHSAVLPSIHCSPLELIIKQFYTLHILQWHSVALYNVVSVQYTAIHYATPWYTVVPPGTLWYPVVPSRTLRYPMVPRYSGTQEPWPPIGVLCPHPDTTHPIQVQYPQLGYCTPNPMRNFLPQTWQAHGFSLLCLLINWS